jgi:hypothetical protein
LPRPDDHSDGPSTLPSPELNPLLNPILGQNMGRWAEVYFTSPPEKREQAVLDLLRELQGENSAPEAPSATSEQESQPFTKPVSQLAEATAPLVCCRACGRENPASHRFCGMCGTPVGEQPPADFNITDVHVVDQQNTGLYREGPRSEHSPSEDQRVAHLFAEDPASLEQSGEPGFAPSDHAVPQSAANPDEFLSARGREFDERDHRLSNLFEPAPESRPYRLYIGIAAVFVLALAYVAWRSLQTSQSSHLPSQAPSTAATQPEAQANPANAATPSSTPNTSTELAPPANTPAVTPSNSASDRSASLEAAPVAKPTAEAAPQAASPTAAIGVAIDEQSLETETISAHGAQELAIAQRYLNGAEGQERNSAEAAKWLWKAIAKHNADATLLLSDLYLKGDGVEKNCDQARVLLDAAAGRGMKGAGERLRNLQAFGCQ